MTNPPLVPPSAASWNSVCSANSICFGPSSSASAPKALLTTCLADVDQLATQPSVVDRAAVVAGVDDADHGGEELGQVGGAADFLQDAGVLELRLQGDGVGKLPGLHPPRDRLVDPAVDRIGEMLRGEELRDALIRLVVGEQRARAAPAPPVGWREGGGGKGRKAASRWCSRRHLSAPCNGTHPYRLWTAVDSGSKWPPRQASSRRSSAGTLRMDMKVETTTRLATSSGWLFQRCANR